MGREKARLDLGGRSLLERSVAILEARTREVVLACGPTARYEELGRRLVLDAEPDGGPLVGLAAALEAVTTPWLLVLACDMPWPERAIDALLRVAREEDDLVLFQRDGRAEPLCALYHRRVLSAVREALELGERRMVGFWEPELRARLGLNGPALAVRRLVAGEGGMLLAPEESVTAFGNVNTPSDLDWARDQEEEQR